MAVETTSCIIPIQIRNIDPDIDSSFLLHHRLIRSTGGGRQDGWRKEDAADVAMPEGVR